MSAQPHLGPPAGEIVHLPERRRYELRLDGEVAAFAGYVESPGVVVVTHTETRPQLQGQGLAGQLTEGMMRDLRGRGLRVIPRCPFTRSWLHEHPEFADLLA